MRELLFRNLRLKVMALVFATALWYFVAGQSDTEAGFVVPLVTSNAPRGLVITTTLPSEVEVRVRGPKTFVSSIDASGIMAEVDFGSIRPGRNVIKVSPDDVSVPVAIEVVRVTPDSFVLEAERAITAEVPVAVRTTGASAKGFKVTALLPTPKSVKIRGVGRVVEGVERLRTRPVSIEGIASTTTISVEVERPSAYLTIEPGRINVRIVVDKER